MSEEFINIRLQEVPEYLRKSKLYITLLSNAAHDLQDEIFQVPVDKFKIDEENIITSEDFKHMIATLLFWDSSTLPVALISFCLDHSEQAIKLFDKEALMLPQLEMLKTVMDSPISKRPSAAARVGSREILQFYFCAAKGGHLECLQYAHSHGCECNWRTQAAALRGKNIGCMHYLYNLSTGSKN